MTKTGEKLQVNIIARNKRARYDYQIEDTWEAGIKLKGIEVKALRAGNISLSESWIRLSGYTALLVGCSISPSRVNPWDNYVPHRDRTLLLKKQQMRKISSALKRGLTLIPLKIYFNDKGLAKVEIATAKGKKQHDKRKAIQERDNRRYGH
jgi:SsrA-binding protein